jgi:hypothetical protein
MASRRPSPSTPAGEDFFTLLEHSGGAGEHQQLGDLSKETLHRNPGWLNFAPLEGTTFASQSMGDVHLPPLSPSQRWSSPQASPSRSFKLSRHRTTTSLISANNNSNNAEGDVTALKSPKKLLPLILTKRRVKGRQQHSPSPTTKGGVRPTTVTATGGVMDVVAVNAIHRMVKTATSSARISTGEAVQGLMKLLPRSKRVMYEKMEIEHAAEVLQRSWRGYKDRMRVWGRDGIHWNYCALVLQCAWKSYLSRKVLKGLKFDRDTKAAIHMQRIARGFLARDLRLRMIEEKRNNAAVSIQLAYRTGKARRVVNKLRREKHNKVATLIQKIIRGKLAKARAARAGPENEKEKEDLQLFVNVTSKMAKREFLDNPRDPVAILNYGMFLLLFARNYGKAKFALEQGLSQHPNDPCLLSAYALVCTFRLTYHDPATMETILDNWRLAALHDPDGSRRKTLIDYKWLWALTKMQPDRPYGMIVYAMYLVAAYTDKPSQGRSRRFAERAGKIKTRQCNVIQHALRLFDSYWSHPTQIIKTESRPSVRGCSPEDTVITVSKRGNLWIINATESNFERGFRPMVIDEEERAFIKSTLPHDLLLGFGDERISSVLLNLLTFVKNGYSYQMTIPKITNFRKRRMKIIARESLATRLQSSYRGYRCRNWLRERKRKLEIQRAQHLAMLQHLQERRDYLWKRYMAVVRLQSAVRGFHARRELRIKTKCAIKLQSRFRGFQVRLKIAEEKRLKALGIHAKEIYRRGHVISGHYMIITVRKCGLNYHFTGYDVEECNTSYGWVMNYQVRHLIDIFPYGVRRGYEKKPHRTFEGDTGFTSAPPHNSPYIDVPKPECEPLTARRLLRQAYQPPTVEDNPPKEYVIQKGQRFRITLANHEGILGLLLSLLALTTPIKNVTNIKREYEADSGKVLTIDPVYGAFAVGKSILPTEHVTTRPSRPLPDQLVNLELIKEKCKIKSDADLKNVYNTKTTEERLKNWNDLVLSQRMAAKAAEAKRQKELAKTREKEEAIKNDVEQRRRMSQLNIEKRKATIAGRLLSLQGGRDGAEGGGSGPLEAVEELASPKGEDVKAPDEFEPDSAEAFYASQMM